MKKISDKLRVFVVHLFTDTEEVSAMTMRDFAEHVIAVAKDNGISVTNLQLQKVMYFSLKDAIRDEILDINIIENIYDEHFEPWPYGPVVPGIYFEYNYFRSSPIILDTPESMDDLNLLNEIIISRLKTKPFELVKISHEEDKWATHEDEIMKGTYREEYSLNDISV